MIAKVIEWSPRVSNDRLDAPTGAAGMCSLDRPHFFYVR